MHTESSQRAAVAGRRATNRLARWYTRHSRTQWTDGDRLTYAYLGMESARSVIEEYDPALAGALLRLSARVLDLARCEAAEEARIAG